MRFKKPSNRVCIIIKDYCLAADWIVVDRIAEPTYHSRMWCGGGFGIKSLFWYFGFIFAQLPNRSLCVSLWGSGAVGLLSPANAKCHAIARMQILSDNFVDLYATKSTPDPQTSDMPITGGVTRPVIIIFLFPSSQEGEAMCLYRTYREFYYWRIELHLFNQWQAHCDLYDFYSQLIRGIRILLFSSPGHGQAVSHIVWLLVDWYSRWVWKQCKMDCLIQITRI